MGKKLSSRPLKTVQFQNILFSLVFSDLSHFRPIFSNIFFLNRPNILFYVCLSVFFSNSLLLALPFKINFNNFYLSSNIFYSFLVHYFALFYLFLLLSICMSLSIYIFLLLLFTSSSNISPLIFSVQLFAFLLLFHLFLNLLYLYTRILVTSNIFLANFVLVFLYIVDLFSCFSWSFAI